MAVIELENVLRERRRLRAKGQKAAIAFLGEEVAQSGFVLAARLLALAVEAIDQDLNGEGEKAPPPS